MDILRFDIDRLFKSCRTLFGEDVLLNRHFLEYIQESGIKSAFRQGALQTHPDRLIHLDFNEQQQKKELFISINNAYQELLNFIKARDEKKAIIETSPYSEFNNQQKDNYNLYRFYRGAIPKRELLFGEFLYYSGSVPWKAYIDAIVWQRQQRPRFGDIAKKWKYIDDENIRFVLKNRTIGEPIGETAIRLALLTKLQVKTIILHQRMNQKKIGEYFYIEGYLSKEEINNLYYEFKKHNSTFRAKKIF
ncbi:MAG: J domain-containing protein [Thermodesulfovibrionales bacterium]|nr:J domain-containing protein [Thermodesulfovibrionales bacterium]